MAIYKNSPPIITDGLTLHYDAANPKCYLSGSNICNDLSGNRNNGTLTNVTFTTEQGGGFVFDGSSSYIGCGTIVETKTVLAFICSWDTSSDRVVFGPLSNGADNWLSVNAAKLYCFFTETPDVNNNSFSGNTILSTNKFYQIAATISTNTVTIFLNAVEKKMSTVAFSIGSWDGYFNFGRRGGMSQRYFNGIIPVIQIYNRILSDTELLQNYNAQKARFGTI